MRQERKPFRELMTIYYHLYRYALGQTDTLKGTGVWGGLEMKREPKQGNSNKNPVVRFSWLTLHARVPLPACAQLYRLVELAVHSPYKRTRVLSLHARKLSKRS